MYNRPDAVILYGIQLMRFKASLSQLLAAFVVVSSLLALLASTSSGPTVWNTETLPFIAPDLPSQFHDNGRPSPNLPIGGFYPATVFDDGAHLFHSEYRFGWELCREMYYRTGTFHNWKTSSIESLDPNEWTPEHLSYARCSGHERCKQQISKLQELHDENSVRDVIGYPNSYRVGPAIAVGALGVIILVHLSRRRQSAG